MASCDEQSDVTVEGTLAKHLVAIQGVVRSMRAGRLAAVVAAVALFLVPSAGVAWAADDYLLTSDPAPHDQLEDVPGWVTLVFKTASDAKLAKIVVQNSQGQDVTTGPLIVEGTNVTAQLMDGLSQDTFTVTYRTSDAKDGPRGGAFQFSYGPGHWTNVDDTWIGAGEEPPQIKTPPPPAPDPTYSETPETPATSEPEPSGTVIAPESSEEPSEATPEPQEQAASGIQPWWFAVGGVLLVAAVGVWAFERNRLRKRNGTHAG